MFDEVVAGPFGVVGDHLFGFGGFLSGFGAAQIRSKLKARIMAANVRRERFRPMSPQW